VPIYNYKCKTCGREWEAIHKMAERGKEWCCNNVASRQMSKTAKPYVFWEYYSEGAGARFKIKAHREKVLKEKNLTCVG